MTEQQEYALHQFAGDRKNRPAKLREACAAALEEVRSLRSINKQLCGACEAKLQALEGVVYDPDAYNSAAKLCRDVLAEIGREVE